MVRDFIDYIIVASKAVSPSVLQLSQKDLRKNYKKFNYKKSL